MTTIAVVYATREGQTRKIAEYVAARLKAAGVDVDTGDAAAIGESFDPSRYSAVILAASLHANRFEPEMVAFVRKHRDGLARLPSAFLCVSLAEVTASNPKAPREQREQARAALDHLMKGFFDRTGWRPEQTLSVAGALKYSAYGFLKRFMMKRIARASGFEGPPNRDYEFTNWHELREFVDAFRGHLPPQDQASP